MYFRHVTKGRGPASSDSRQGPLPHSLSVGGGTTPPALEAWGRNGGSSAAGAHQESVLLKALLCEGREGLQGTGTVAPHSSGRQPWKSTERAEGGDSSRKGEGTSETLLLEKKNIKGPVKIRGSGSQVRDTPKI